MPVPPMLRSLPPLVALLLACSACHPWVPVAAPTPLHDSTRFTGRLRFTDSAGATRIAPQGAFVRGPSVLFLMEGLASDSVPTRSVVRVEQRRVNVGRTIGRVVLVGGGIFVVTLIVIAATWQGF